MAGDREKFLESWMDARFVKPLDRVNLEGVIVRAMSRRKVHSCDVLEVR